MALLCQAKWKYSKIQHSSKNLMLKYISFLFFFLVIVYRNQRLRRAVIEDLEASADFTVFESNERSRLLGSHLYNTTQSAVNDEAPDLQRTGNS